MAERYVWLNIKTGEFSNSWSDAEFKIAAPLNELMEVAKQQPEWKLIKFECLTDPTFNFSNLMVIK